ncbi:acyl-CoA thioesterase [Flavihumibacter sp. R14]|nr:acyl-CoA thioesterase [Flavihumibacter soli]
MNLNNFHYKTPVAIRFADIDAFGHVNNAVYMTYFEIARSNYWNEVIHWDWGKMGIIIGRAEITYLKPIVLKDEIFAYVRTSRIGNSSFDLDYILVRMTNGVEEICTTGSTTCVSFDYGLNTSAAIPDEHRSKMMEFEALEI